MSRFRRPKWRDPRLGVGILLIAASVALGGWVFAQADKTDPFYIASEPIPVGTSASHAPMEISQVQLAGAAGHYLGPETLADLDLVEPVFITPVQPGELIPISAVGEAEDLLLRPLSVTVTHSSLLKVGDVVDMWMKQEDVTGREASEPELVAQGLHVTGIDTDESVFAPTNGRIVHVLVTDGDLEAVLGALGSKAIITLIPRLSG